ncbi:hypothetical protein BGX29_008277 [Mortierella sp. GBA35]|nr:hypothetical protein BGX29_008277 [Mortierella sp. GBA35]
MFKFSAKNNNNNTTTNNNEGGGFLGESGYNQGVAFLEESMGLTREEIELYLDLMISHLEQLSSDSEMTDKIQVDDNHHHQSLPTLSDNELAQIRTFLILTTPTDSGMDRLHNQYRFVDSQGIVQ